MSDLYGIEIFSKSGNVSLYRPGSYDNMESKRWPLAEAEEIAWKLFVERRPTYVAFGSGDHEFRMWSDEITSYGNFCHTGVRWAEWYVDVEVNGRRWRYRPVASLDDFDAADELAEIAATLHPDVTRVWTGCSDSDEEYEHETREG